MRRVLLFQLHLIYLQYAWNFFTFKVDIADRKNLDYELEQ